MITTTRIEKKRGENSTELWVENANIDWEWFRVYIRNVPFCWPKHICNDQFIRNLFFVLLHICSVDGGVRYISDTIVTFFLGFSKNTILVSMGYFLLHWANWLNDTYVLYLYLVLLWHAQLNEYISFPLEFQCI